MMKISPTGILILRDDTILYSNTTIGIMFADLGLDLSIKQINSIRTTAKVQSMKENSVTFQMSDITFWNFQSAQI